MRVPRGGAALETTGGGLGGSPSLLAGTCPACCHGCLPRARTAPLTLHPPCHHPRRDTDVDGVQLAATADPLGEAQKLVARLRAHAGPALQTHLLAFEVRLDRGAASAGEMVNVDLKVSARLWRCGRSCEMAVWAV